MVGNRVNNAYNTGLFFMCGMVREKTEKNMNLVHRGPEGTAIITLCGVILLFAVMFAPKAHAENIKNKVAVFAALNKVTARISHLEIPIDAEQKFGALTIKPRVCNTTPPTEAPSTTSFIEIKERKLNGTQSNLFTGWVFAENPGLHAVEHPVYDLWLTSCKMPAGEVATSKSEKLQRRRTRVRSRRR